MGIAGQRPRDVPRALQEHAHQGRRHAIRQHVPRSRRGDRCRHRRSALGVRHGLMAGREASELRLQPPGRRVLGRGAQSPRADAHQRRLPLVARRHNGRAGRRFRGERACRPVQGLGPRRAAAHVLGDLAAAGGGRPRDRGLRDRRRMVDAAADGLPARRRARLRRPHGGTTMDLPLDPPSRRDRPRVLAGGLLARGRSGQRLDVDERRPRPRLRLPTIRDTVQRLVRRAPSRRQPVRGQPGLP